MGTGDARQLRALPARLVTLGFAAFAAICVRLKPAPCIVIPLVSCPAQEGLKLEFFMKDHPA